MLWVIATANKHELDVQEQLEAIGLQAIAPRRVDMIRQGKRRRPDAVISAYLPGYVFAWFGDDDWHAVREAKHVINLMGVSPQTERHVRAFIARVEADFAARMAQIEAGERVSEYNPGDLLTILAGPFAGQLARFGRMVERAHVLVPQIEATLDVFGRPVRVELDPIAVKKAAGGTY